jgi:D-alanyl-D-alanine carboxypeptidase (penicillin-binding protein 5/6)
MKTHRLISWIVGCLCLWQASAMAANTLTVIPEPPVLPAKAHVLMDYNSGKILSSQNMDEHLEPASLTKLMLMYVANKELQANNIKLTDIVRISENAWKSEGSRMFLEVNKEVTVDELIHGIIIQSGNDASIALAEHIAGTEQGFVDLMNSYAAALGMTNSHFGDVNGMPHENHYSSAHDLAILARAIITEFPPELYAIHAQKWFTYNGIKQPNRNRLLWRDPSVDGLKTGSTEGAGYCLVASAQKNNMRLISVVLGADSDANRADQSQRLLSYGFRFFETHKLYAAGDTLNQARLWMGQVNSLPLGVKEDIYVTIPQGQYKNLQASLNVDKLIKAPVSQGQNLGNLEVKLGETIVVDAPLVALSSTPKGGIWRRFTDYVSMRASQLLGSSST